MNKYALFLHDFPFGFIHAFFHSSNLGKNRSRESLIKFDPLTPIAMTVWGKLSRPADPTKKNEKGRRRLLSPSGVKRQ